MSQELIGTKTIAAELGMTRSYVTQKLVKHPRFPAPKLKLSQKTVLWERADFDAWREAEAIRAAGRSERLTRESKRAEAG